MYRNENEEAPVLVVVFNGRAFGVEPGTGARLWEHEVESPGADRAIDVHVDQSRVILCTANRLKALDYPTGALLWEVGVKGEYTSRPSLLVRGGLVFVGRGGEVGCYAIHDGSLVWHDGFAGKGIGRVALAVPGDSRQMDTL